MSQHSEDSLSAWSRGSGNDGSELAGGVSGPDRTIGTPEPRKTDSKGTPPGRALGKHLGCKPGRRGASDRDQLSRYTGKERMEKKVK